MYALLSKLAEILSSYGTRFLDHRRSSRDIEVAGQLLRIILLLQDLCVRGERLLILVGGFTDGTADTHEAAMFEDLLDEQVRTLADLRTALDSSRELLATVDARFFIDLAPFLDFKSGLLTRWSQQVALSRFSTTTLFFLPASSLRRILEIVAVASYGGGLGRDRADYLMTMTDALREVRTHEIRDIRVVGAEDVERLRSEIAQARTDLDHARGLCAGLLDSTERAVGTPALAGLRRKLWSNRDAG